MPAPSAIRKTSACAALLAVLLAACTTPSKSPPAAAEAEARTQAMQAARAAAERSRAREAATRHPAPPFAPAPVASLAHAPMPMPMPQRPLPRPAENTEHYDTREDNPVRRTREAPVSTFSIDVDTGSYANVRRMLRDGYRPPADAVRVEEMLNYFDYGHPAPASREVPFKVTTELAPAPWNPARQLLMVGIKGYDVDKRELPPANLVLLVDTSGSMDDPAKLPLLKRAFAQLVPQLRAMDRVSIVAYAGHAGLVLAPTPGDRHGEILAALEQLQAAGSTNGGEGLRLAYAMARQGYVEGGVNRILLATDGDFNVGITDRNALLTLVADQRRTGIALSTLGFGSGNYNDAMAERLADAGNGQHLYIDTLDEARRVLLRQMQATLLTIANDVKVQIEFNPAVVAEYRLVGYENRILREEDFANDRVDAGDIGAGHEVTALYEITLAGSGAERLPPLRYGDAAPAASAKADELAHLRLRYKLPGQDASRLVETPVLRSSLRSQASKSLRFAAAVAGYADLLRGGKYVDRWTWDDVERTARGALGEDRFGLRHEFVQLVDSARSVTTADMARGQPEA
ncbi:hypothetical protein CSC68_06455 [Pseudoxanthomonas suwonensis]|nr:hypothetical protein CSC68_06455 [Pseudoxanthomonas suwonensis]